MRTLLAVTILVATAQPSTLAEAAGSRIERASCHGERATVVGTAGPDDLTGTAGRDVVVALGGNDVIRTRRGNDLVCAGAGSDQVSGGLGDDRIQGGADLVQRSPYYHRGDFIDGGAGSDVLAPGTDDRARAGDGGGDLLSWQQSPRGVTVDLAAGTALGDGRDRVVGRPERVVLSTWGDTFRGTDGPEVVHAAGGPDEVITAGGDDKVYADEEEATADDVVSTGPGDDVVWSYGGTDHLRTGDGADFLAFVGRVADLHGSAGAGRDRVEALVRVLPDHALDGGEGRDTVVLEVVTPDVEDHTFDLTSGELLLGPDEVAATVAGFEDAELYQGRFTVNGTDAANSLVVNLATHFAGGGGDDVLTGSEEDDSFDGGTGQDSYLSDSGGTNTCTSVESDPNGVCVSPGLR